MVGCQDCDFPSNEKICLFCSCIVWKKKSKKTLRFAREKSHTKALGHLGTTSFLSANPFSPLPPPLPSPPPLPPQITGNTFIKEGGFGSPSLLASSQVPCSLLAFALKIGPHCFKKDEKVSPRNLSQYEVSAVP